MKNAYDKALILAGGKGTRLRHLGAVLPKCLTPVFDEPLLVRQIQQCVCAGVREVYISVASRFTPLFEEFAVLYSDQAKQARKYKSIPPVALHVLPESKPLGAMRGLIEASEAINDSRALIMLGDEFFEHDSGFRQLGNVERAEKIMINAVETSDLHRIQCNVILDEGGQITRIRDKPPPDSIVGKVRWEGVIASEPGFQDMAIQAIDSQLVSGTHLGDLLEGIRRLGVGMGVAWFEERCVNLNTPDDFLMASLLTAGQQWRSTRPDHPLLLESILTLADILSISRFADQASQSGLD